MYGIPPETLIIRGSQDHALVGPLNTVKGFSKNTAGTLFLFGVSSGQAQ